MCYLLFEECGPSKPSRLRRDLRSNGARGQPLGESLTPIIDLCLIVSRSGIVYQCSHIFPWLFDRAGQRGNTNKSQSLSPHGSGSAAHDCRALPRSSRIEMRMLIQDESVLKILRAILRGLTADGTLREDLMQAAIIHRWLLEQRH